MFLETVFFKRFSAWSLKRKTSCLTEPNKSMGSISQRSFAVEFWTQKTATNKQWNGSCPELLVPISLTVSAIRWVRKATKNQSNTSASLEQPGFMTHHARCIVQVWHVWRWMNLLAMNEWTEQNELFLNCSSNRNPIPCLPLSSLKTRKDKDKKQTQRHAPFMSDALTETLSCGAWWKKRGLLNSCWVSTSGVPAEHACLHGC